MEESMDRYEIMIAVPKALSEEFARHEREQEKIQGDFQNEKESIQEEFESAEAASSEDRGSQKSAAEARYRNWSGKADQYEKASNMSHGRTTYVLQQAFPDEPGSVSPAEAILRLQSETDQRARRHRKDDNQTIITLCEREMQTARNIKDIVSRLRDAAASQKDQEVRYAETRYNEEHAANEQMKYVSQRRSIRKQQVRLEREEDAFLERIESRILPDKVREEYVEMQRQQPDYEIFEPSDTFPRGIQFGYAGYDITRHAEDPLKNAVLSRRFGYAVHEADGRKYLTVPYGFSFDSSQFSTMIKYQGEKGKTQAADIIRDIALNLFMSIPVNKCWCTFIDPVALGNTFAVFSPMGERDESGKGDERAIDTRIWSSERDIEERLKLTVDHTTDVIQRCLQGRYENILDYNEDAGINAEPLRFLVIMDFPRNFSKQALNYLDSIIDNGPKTGVYTIIAADKEEVEGNSGGIPLARIRSRIKNVITTEDGIFYTQESTEEGMMRYFPFSSPSTKQSVEIISEIRRHLGEEIIITYPMISGNLPARKDYWFHKSALDGISVPIGMEGAGKIVNLEFGHPYNSFAAMIGGTIGAGKDVLIHTFIMSVILNYSPEDVQMYLLDFKQGVEFKCYADHRLSNFRVVSIETEPEFGLAVLEELHKEMERRSAKFRSTGTATIESYWRYKGQRGESHADMPRLIIVFDEVQALLGDEENEIVKKSCSLITELVTQAARAYGMHLILSTQTFENVKGLNSGIYGNMHTRIALKSTKASATILLDNENEIAGRLMQMDPGQGVINNNAGVKDANRTLRVALITPDEREKLLTEAHDWQMERMTEEPEKPRILLSGPEDDVENPLTIFSESGLRPSGFGDPSYHLYIGESLTMINTFLPALRNNRGQNLLIVGRDEGDTGLSRMVIGYSALSLLMETIRLKGEITTPFITLFDLSGAAIYGTRDFDMLEQITSKVPEAFRAFPPNMILEGIDTLFSEMNSGRQQFVIFYGLNRANQLTLGTSYERSPKEQLETMFAAGPENGMNFIVWANDPGRMLEDYGMAMRSFEIRLAYGMDDKEYKSIIGSNGPKYRSPMNAISFNMVGDAQKIRAYSRPTEEWLMKFLMNIRKYVH